MDISRKREFPMSNQKQSVHDGDYRCERCWSEKNINLYPRSDFLGGDANGFAILCDRCKSEAPKEKDLKKFENLFLRFASTKEFLLNYNATSEQEALMSWCKEMQIDESPIETISPNKEKNHDEVGGLDQKIPFGYELRGDTLTINPKDADVVRGIFDSYLSGNTMEKIARELLKDAGNESIKWSLNEVREILKDPTYAGYEFKGSNVVLGVHEVIVDKATFNRVQKRIVRNIRNPKYLYKPLILGD